MASPQSMTRKCKNIRDRLYQQDHLPAAVFREEVLRLASGDASIADIGCGREARFLRSVAPRFARAYGIDLQIAEDASDGHVTLIQGDAEAIPLPRDTVDVVTLSNVIEHLRDPRRALAECRRILKPGGHIVLIAPNKMHPPIAVGRALPHRLRQLANRIVTETDMEDTFPAYYRANSANALRNLARSLKLESVRLDYVSNHPVYFMFSTFVYRCAAAFEQRVLRRGRLAWLCQYILCHLRKPVE